MVDVFVGKTQTATEGRWVKWQDAELLVAEMPNDRYSARLIQIREELRKGALERVFPESEEHFEAILRSMAETILIGWKNITSGGEELEYTSAMAFQVMLNNRESDLLNTVTEAAREEKAYRVTLADEIKKKPEASYAGGNGTASTTRKRSSTRKNTSSRGDSKAHTTQPHN